MGKAAEKAIKVKNGITYVQSGVEGLENIAELWRKLIRHHADLSTYFGEDIARITWEERKKSLLDKAKNGGILVEAAKEKDKLIGYCISSVTDKQVGEIESIYIEKEYRRHHIGDHFMKTAVSWMDERGTTVKTIGVAFGNEEVFKFYRKYNFFPRSTILWQK